MGNKQKEITE